jgi:hypothetical protein
LIGALTEALEFTVNASLENHLAVSGGLSRARDTSFDLPNTKIKRHGHARLSLAYEVLGFVSDPFHPPVEGIRDCVQDAAFSRSDGPAQGKEVEALEVQLMIFSKGSEVLKPQAQRSH